MKPTREETARDVLFGRRGAYNRVFNAESQDVKVVLTDIGIFCRADKSTFHTDPRAHALAEGRREVWLRIQKYLNLSEKELWENYIKGDS